MVYMLIARLHLKAAKSQPVHEAQGKLLLVPAENTVSVQGDGVQNPSSPRLTSVLAIMPIPTVGQA